MKITENDLILLLHAPSQEGDEVLIADEKQALTGYLRLLGANFEYREILDLDQLCISVIEGVQFAERNNGRLFVHYSGHANEEGIALNNGHVTWMHLQESLTNLEVDTASTLILVMSTCHGATAQDMVMLNRPIPFRLMVGPSREVNWDEAFLATSLFYHQINLGFLELEQAAEHLADTLNSVIAPNDEQPCWSVVTGRGVMFNRQVEHLRGALDWNRLRPRQ